jgi:hypothetical protein
MSFDGDIPVCAYCGVTPLKGKERLEHPIPAALGSRLALRIACDDCNAWVGREVDQPFLADGLLRETRSLLDQRDFRRVAKAKRVTSQMLQGFTADGDYISFDHETQRPVMKSRIVDLGDGRFQIRAGSRNEAERLFERIKARAAREGKTAEPEVVEEREDQPAITGTIEVRLDVWRRAGAKIALALAAEAYPASWRQGEDAAHLRDWMRDSDSEAPPLLPRDPPGDLNLAPHDEHVAFFQRFGDGVTYLIAILLGQQMIALPVDRTGLDVPSLAWSMDWRSGKVHASTLPELIMRIVDRQG